jgi:hypothetical protein
MNAPSHAQPPKPDATRWLTASLDESRRAEALRRRIHERYLANADRRSNP